MKLSKQQENAEVKLALKAACGALKQHFTGSGAKQRTITFLKKSGTTFVYSLTGIFAFAASAAVSRAHRSWTRGYHARFPCVDGCDAC